MSVRKRNEYLEDEESDGFSDKGYDSEAAEESRGALAGRGIKRRQVEVVSDDASLDGADEEGDGLHDPTARDVSADEESGTGDDEGDFGMMEPQESTRKPKMPKDVIAAQKAARRSGVVYISRVPPFLKPQTLRHFLAPHAPKGLGRIFLTPEDHTAHVKRVRNGGNKKKTYTDGWVEFVSKAEAKAAAETLNGNTMGGKKGNFYHDDIWSMKYLKGFKWSHLTEQIANENAERQARLREEIRKMKKENKAFVEDIERGKMLDGMEVKQKAKQQRGGDVKVVDRGKVKEFKQKKVQRPQEGKKMSEQATKVQRMIF